MRHPLVRIMEQNPVVPALKDLSHLDECLRCPSGVVFVLCGDILNIVLFYFCLELLKAVLKLHVNCEVNISACESYVLRLGNSIFRVGVDL